MNQWINTDKELPKIGDYSVLVYFKHDAIDMVHVEDYFKPITNGLDDLGRQKYTLWHIGQGVTHWMPLPKAPEQND